MPLKQHKKRGQGLIKRRRKPLGARSANVLSNLSNVLPAKGRAVLQKKGAKIVVRTKPAVVKARRHLERVPVSPFDHFWPV